MRNKFLTVGIILSFLTGFLEIQAQQIKSFKRGLAYSIPYAEDLPTLGKGISWFYNWGTAPGLQVASIFDPYIDYIPMCWNGVDTTALKTFYSSHPNIKYILGFNEPNFKSQANLTPTQAAAKWPLIERIARLYHLKIVGPALNYCSASGAVSENGITYTDPIQYYDDFFKACPNCQVDYIAMHNYMNFEPAVVNDITRYKKYGKPIWLTEFCQYDGTQTLTPDTQKDYMVELLSYMENDPDVFRYSWFIGRNGGGDTAFPYNSLLTKDNRGVLTELGDIYIHMSSFDRGFYYTDRDTIQAEKFINSHSASLRRMDATSGDLYLNDFYFKDWTAYQVDMPETKEYTLTFRMACIDGTTLQVLDSLGNILASQDVPSTGGLTSWSFRSLRATLPAGKQTITLKSMGEGCNINWFTFANIDTALKNTVSAKVVDLFPSPVKDQLFINTQENTTSIKIFNISGSLVFEGTNQKSIATADFSQGIYIVQLTFDDGEMVTRKILK